MAQLVLGVAGAVVGSAFGMPGIGWAIGSAIGGALAPTQKSYGPRLSDLKVTTVEYGSPIPIIEGHPRISGTVAWCSDKIEVENTTSQGKGGGAESTSYTYKVNILILLADNEILGIRRIWSTGKLVWSIADDSDEETIEASEETTSWDAMRVYTGAMDQLPDPVYEAAVGLGSAPAYRGRGYVFFEGLNLGSSGQLPNLTFEVNAKVSEGTGATRLLLQKFAEVDKQYTPPHGAAESTVKMTVEHKSQLKTYDSTGPTYEARLPINGRVLGQGNGDRALVVYGLNGVQTTWGGFIVAGDGLEVVVNFPSAFQREWLGGEGIRFSVWGGHIAVGTADAIGTPGEWMQNLGKVWLYTTAGVYVGYADVGDRVNSVALTTSFIYVQPVSGAVRVFEVGTGPLAEIDPIPLPSGSNHVIFIGEDGKLYCANAGKQVYEYALDEWVLRQTLFYLDEEGDAVDLGTNNARHFVSANGSIYAAVPVDYIKPLPPDYIEYWSNSLYSNSYAANRSQNIFDVVRAAAEIVWSGFLATPRPTIISNCRQYIATVDVEDPPIPYTIGIPGSTAAYIMQTVRIQILADVFVLGEWRDTGASETVFLVREINDNDKTVYAHDVYYAPIDLTGTLVDANLQDVVERLCYRAGLKPADVDATALAGDWVHAFAIPPGAAKGALDQLAAAYYFESYESDKLYFVKRGGDPVLTIPYRDLGADAQLQITDPNDLELPAQVYVTYQNLNDDYQQGSEQSDRLTTDSTAINNIQLALGFEPAQAKGIADTACLDQTIGARSLAFALDRRYAQLVPTDVVLLDDSFGNTFRARVIKVSDADGVRTVEAVADDASALNPTGTTSDNYTPSYTVRARALTDLLLLDMPILRDVDDGPGLYAAGDGLAGTWPGYVLMIEGLQAGTSTTGAAMGATLDTLGVWSGGLVDECNSVTVQLNPGDQLTSITHAQLTSSIGNYCAIGVHGRWEVLQYRSAELIATGQYRLRGLLRGQLGTEHLTGTHAVGDRFVALDGAGLLRPAASIADIETTRQYRGVTIGALIDSAAVQAVTHHGVGMLPYAPVNLRQAHSGADIVLAWDRRTRYQTNLLTSVIPLGEAAERYEVDVMDGTAVKRTLDTTSPTATYTEAQQIADFGAAQAVVSVRVAQISANVGRGTPLIFEAP